LTEVSVEWDNICEKREAAIECGKDVSLMSVTAPWLIRRVREVRPKRLLDAGCGSGYITAQLVTGTDYCCGVDASRKSIALAREKYRATGIQFSLSPIADFHADVPFDLCVSMMALTSDPTWLASVQKIHSLLVPSGLFLIMISHPCFWPKYWGYQSEPWFNYNKEIYIEHDFSISLVKSMGKTTYIHRPLTQYYDGLIEAGFTVEKLEEPYPTSQTPDGYSYQYPRFLFLQCRKKG